MAQPDGGVEPEQEHHATLEAAGSGESHSMLRTLFLATILAAAAPCSLFADDTPTQAQPEIRGAVTEVGTHLPISGVNVEIFRWPDEGPRPLGVKHDDTVTVRTDSSGVFQLRVERLGDYSVEIRKDGWSADRSLNPILNTSLGVRLTKDHPHGELKFQMARTGELAGSVVDFETRKPVANLHVWAMQTRYSGRQRSAWPAGQAATTGADGRFVIQGLMPGDYVVQIRRTEAAEHGLRLEFTGKDLETVEHGYQETYWPGGGDMSAAVPLAVGAGAQALVGEIVAKRVALYRIHGSVAAGGCAPGEKISLAQVIRQYGADEHRILGELPCGKDFLLVDKEPGTYWLNAAVSRGGRNLTGSAAVSVEDKNAEAAIALEPGVTVEARVVVPEGSQKPDFQSIRLLLGPVGGTATGFDQPDPPDADGRIRLADVPVRDYEVTVFLQPRSFYVKELRYNGSALAGRILSLNAGAMAHNLEIVLDDKPAAITGAVGDSDHRTANAYVRLVKCPLSDATYRELIATVAGGDGRFQIGGLAPGTYRVFAVEREAMGDLENFTILDRVLAGAKEIALGPNGLQDVTLDLADTRR
jgi:hypothetical protein